MSQGTTESKKISHYWKGRLEYTMSRVAMYSCAWTMRGNNFLACYHKQVMCTISGSSWRTDLGDILDEWNNWINVSIILLYKRLLKYFHCLEALKAKFQAPCLQVTQTNIIPRASYFPLIRSKKIGTNRVDIGVWARCTTGTYFIDLILEKSWKLWTDLRITLYRCIGCRDSWLIWKHSKSCIH